MTLYKNKYRVESTRLKGWDYSSPGAYFITICTKNREWLFGDVVQKSMFLNNNGKIVEKCWFDLPRHYENLELDQFVIMPNHVHGIMMIDIETVPASRVETGLKPVSTETSTAKTTDMDNRKKKPHGLFEFVRALKTFSARRINEHRKTYGKPVWQTRFYDRIIRDDNELYRIRNYIMDNPANWKNDENFTTEVTP